MKKNVLVAVFTMCVVFITKDVLAQGNLRLLEVDFSIPIQEKHEFFGTNPNYDSSYFINSSINVSTDGSSSFFSRIKDSITFQLNSTNYYRIISFTLDSLKKQFQNFYYKFAGNSPPGGGYPYGGYQTDIKYSTMQFSVSRDTLIAYKYGSECVKDLAYASYSENETDSPTPNYSGKSIRTERIRNEDTSGFGYYIKLLYPGYSDLSNVKEKNAKVYLSILNSFQNIYFSFPPYNQFQTLLIYDILGREVKRIEIPSGVSEYRLQRDGFMNGYYFARLGSQSASFIVN